VQSNGYAMRFRQPFVRFDDKTDGLHILTGVAHQFDKRITFRGVGVTPGADGNVFQVTPG
jgi:hypothetical protein